MGSFGWLKITWVGSMKSHNELIGLVWWFWTLFILIKWQISGYKLKKWKENQRKVESYGGPNLPCSCRNLSAIFLWSNCLDFDVDMLCRLCEKFALKITWFDWIKVAFSKHVQTWKTCIEVLCQWTLNDHNSLLRCQIKCRLWHLKLDTFSFLTV